MQGSFKFSAEAPEQISNLVILAQKGDSQAFAKLYDLFVKDIFRFVYFRVKSRQDAEDLTQKVFLKTFKELKKKKGKYHNFRAWLYQVTRRTVIDYYRTFKIHLSLRKQKIYFKEEKIEKLEAKEVFELLDKLKDKEKEVLILNLVEGFNLKEIAKILGKSPVAVRLIKHKAIKKLKKWTK